MWLASSASALRRSRHGRLRRISNTRVTIDEVISDILRREGGFVSHLADRGGPTKFGITASTLYEWRGRLVSQEDVRTLTEAEARDIYLKRYVTDHKLEQIPNEQVRALVVDDGVLSGPRTAIQTLQRVLKVPFDGVLGPQTIAAVAAANPDALIVQLTKARCLRYARLAQRDPSQAVFIAGWIDRAFDFLEA